jgi:hypothetical protein
MSIIERQMKECASVDAHDLLRCVIAASSGFPLGHRMGMFQP